MLKQSNDIAMQAVMLKLKTDTAVINKAVCNGVKPFSDNILLLRWESILCSTKFIYDFKFLIFHMIFHKRELAILLVN